jgi:hypothetical protein
MASNDFHYEYRVYCGCSEWSDFNGFWYQKAFRERFYLFTIKRIGELRVIEEIKARCSRVDRRDHRVHSLRQSHIPQRFTKATFPVQYAVDAEGSSAWRQREPFIFRERIKIVYDYFFFLNCTIDFIQTAAKWWYASVAMKRLLKTSYFGFRCYIRFALLRAGFYLAEYWSNKHDQSL